MGEEGVMNLKVRAAVMGYRVDSNTGRIRAVIVAVQSKGKWRVAGGVTKGISPEVIEALESQVDSIRRKEPFIKTRYKARWVEPAIRCDIRADYSEKEDKFKSLQFLSLR